MIVYHGTTLKAAEAIKREGLKPTPDKGFHFGRDDNWLPDEDVRGSWEDHYVFVSTSQDRALDFAHFRAEYEKTRKGGTVQWGLNVNVTKLSFKRDVTAKPALVVFDLPEDWLANLKPDPNDGGDYIKGLTCRCTIPPEFVKEVKAL